MEQSQYLAKLRRFILVMDSVAHFLVALVLLACAVLVLARAVPGLFHAESTRDVLHLLNDVLLSLIFLEILWPVVRFLQRAPFKLSPFLYVGIISSTRRILLIEAEHSVAAKVSDTGLAAINWQVPVELLVNVVVILVLAIALKLTSENSGDELTH